MSKDKNDSRGVSIDESRSDLFLQFLVGLVNRSGADMGLTLNVGGALISGFLSSHKKYFEWFSNEFAAGVSGDDEELFETIKNAFTPPSEEESKEKAQHFL